MFMAALLDDRMVSRDHDIPAGHNFFGDYISDKFTATGLRVFLPERFSTVDSQSIAKARKILKRDGIVIFEKILTDTEIKISRDSIVADVCRAMHPEKYINQRVPNPGTRCSTSILSVLNAIEPCDPPTEWFPDGILEDNRLPH